MGPLRRLSLCLKYRFLSRSSREFKEGEEPSLLVLNEPMSAVGIMMPVQMFYNISDSKASANFDKVVESMEGKLPLIEQKVAFNSRRAPLFNSRRALPPSCKAIL